MARKRRFIIDIDEETNKKKLVLSDIILLLVFGGLIALVIWLVLMVAKKEKDPTNIVADMVVPIIEKGSKNEFTVNLDKIEDKKYIIRVVNYRNDIINKNEMDYDIEVINENNVEIEIYKNEIEDNLASINNKDLFIEKNVLKAEEKQDDVYKIVVVSDKDLTKKDTLKIIITS